MFQYIIYEIFTVSSIIYIHITDFNTPLLLFTQLHRLSVLCALQYSSNSKSIHKLYFFPEEVIWSFISTFGDIGKICFMFFPVRRGDEFHAFFHPFTGIPDPEPLRANTSPVHGRGTLRARAIAEPWGLVAGQDKGRFRCMLL